ncbi:MAG TPA: ABC transporter ATP-binding protein [Candidatus Dormibacteraeota bacterium]
MVKAFGRVRALDKVNLRVRTGEIYGLLGPNGSGKTTLIRALVGLLAPDAGMVTVLGRRMPNVAVLEEIGYMTQQAALYTDLSVEENVGFFASIFGAEDNVDEALKFVDLQARRGDAVANLSGGMRTRVSLACAVVHGPRVLLLDEPTVGVDPQLRAQLWAGFRRMSAAGVTIVVSSHIMDEAERCDRLGLIRSGRLLAEGTADELRGRAGVDRLEDAFMRLSAEADR